MYTLKKKAILAAILTLFISIGTWSYFASKRLPNTQQGKVFPSIKVVTQEEEFYKLRKKHHVLLVFFHMKQCGPCSYLSPTINQLASENKHANVHFIKIDRANAEKLCNKYKIKMFPTVLIFKKGKLVKQFEGCSQSKATFFAQEIEKLLKHSKK